MLGLVLFIVGILIVVVGLIVAFGVGSNGSRSSGVMIFGISAIVGAVFIFGPMIGSVDAKKVGVVTSMKKPTGEVKGAGGYLSAPWESVTEMDAAAQTKTYEFGVQLSAGSSATVTIYPNWNMEEAAAPQLFQDYKSFDEVVKSLFEQQLVSTANNIFGTYNPLTNVDPKTGEQKKTKEQWASELKTALENNPLIKGKLKINSLSIPTIAPDKNTQENLNKIVAEFAKGGVLDQQKINAQKEKEITDTNSKVDPVTRCLEIANKNNTEPGWCLNAGFAVSTK